MPVKKKTTKKKNTTTPYQRQTNAISKVSPKPELKFYERTTSQTATVTGSGNIAFNLNDVSSGTGRQNRLGQQIHCRGLYVRWQWFNNDTNNGQQMRVIIAVTKGNNGGQIGVPQLLDQSIAIPMLSQINMDYRTRTTILKDHIFSAPTFPNSNNNVQAGTWYIPLDFVTTFMTDGAGGSSGVNNVADNLISMFCMSTGISTNCTFNTSYRLRFSDL